MTPLRAKYIRDLVVRGRSKHIQEAYIRYVCDLARYYRVRSELISYEGCTHRAKRFDSGVRGCSQMRVNSMDPSKEGKGNQDEKHDRADKEEPRLVPSDLDIDEGDEENREETDLPPAMPPKV